MLRFDMKIGYDTDDPNTHDGFKAVITHDGETHVFRYKTKTGVLELVNKFVIEKLRQGGWY